VHDNYINVQELKQNIEYGGCEMAGAFGIQVEFDPEVTSSAPTGIVIQNNVINATANACDAAGLRITSMTPSGRIKFLYNKVTTSNTGSTGLDRSLYVSATNEGSNMFGFTGNTFQSQHAWVGSDWDGGSVVVPSGQRWLGTPKYAIDDQNGFLAGSVSFSQAITIDDLISGGVGCGSYARSVDRVGNRYTNCGH
jgi:hypothetical protein